MHREIPSTVLIVDHVPHDCKLVVDMVKKNLGLPCAEMHCGAKALEYLQGGAEHEGSAVGLVLIDLSLSDIEGMTLLRKVKAMVPWVPVIAMTENRDVDHAVCTIQSGADDFLLKPVLESRLVAAVKNAIDKGKMRREIDSLRGQGGGDTGDEATVDVSLCDAGGVVKSMADLEVEIAARVLDHCGGNVSKASKALGLARSTFYRKLNGAGGGG